MIHMSQTLFNALGLSIDTNKNLNVQGKISLPDGSQITSVPKVTSIVPDDNTYTMLGAYAVDVAGGYVTVNGSGFQNGATVVIGSLVAISVAYVNPTQLNVAVPPQAAGTYTVYVVNPDSSVAIRVNGLQYSSMPVWTGSSSFSADVTNVSIQLSATSDSAVTYSLQSGSSLPSGLTLSSSGLLAGSVSGITLDTTYNFTVVATDAEQQTTPRAISVTVTFSDQYFKYTTMLLHADGSNGATNNTFLDSSPNNYTVTRNGTPTQGSFSPFSQTGWCIQTYSGYGPYTTVSGTAMNPYTNSTFTVECWIYPNSLATQYGTIAAKGTTGNRDWALYTCQSGGGSRDITWYYSPSSGDYTISSASNVLTVGVWQHVAVVSTALSVKIYVNGVQVASGTQVVTNSSNPTRLTFGSFMDYGTQPFDGYISNFRYTSGQALYTGAFTPPTAPLTTTSVGTTGGNVAASLTGTVAFLAFQDNRFKENSSNGYQFTISGTPTVQPFSPFAPSGPYSASSVGGSIYVNGSTDWLNVASGNILNLNSSSNWTIEVWVYPTSAFSGYQQIICGTGISLGSYGGTPYITNNSGGMWHGSTFVQYQWHHLALVNVANTSQTFYMNGVALQGGSATSFTATNTSIGSNYNGTQLWTGYISGVRVVNGTALYNGSTYTVPTSPPTAITNTTLLVSGTNAGIYDHTTKNDLVTFGSAQISTAQSKFGGSSISFDGTNSYLRSFSAHTSNFGTADFTVEYYIYTNTHKNYNVHFDCRSGSTTSTTGFCTGSDSAGHFYLYCNGFLILTSNTYSTGTWYHLAFVRSNGTVKCYVNGTNDGTVSLSNNFTDALCVVGVSFVDQLQWLNGYIDELRVTRGIARYTTNFTPAAAAFQNK